MKMEEYGRVLDYLAQGRATDRYREPIAHVMGETYFTLLEVLIKKDSNLSIGERIYVGKEGRSEVERIKRRIEYLELTSTAKSQVESVIKEIVISKESEFVNFFNKCGSISIRQHQLELLPGIGKKHTEEIKREREERPFDSFRDIQERVSLMPDPINVIVMRILEEIKTTTKYYLFAKPPIINKE
ncbi:MAG: DUF655 domain-containing protein [Candidatus Micrarchaeia archaeon]|jgi:putative nucleotide binding protein